MILRHPALAPIVITSLGLSVALAGACGGGGAGNTGGGGASSSSSSTSSSTGSGGSSSSSSGQGGGFNPTGTGGGGGACVADQATATLKKRPVDVIVVADTSPSMGPAIDSVEANINDNLAAVLGSSGLDYQVIVLAGYGAGSAICVSPPLGGAICGTTPPPKPANTATFHQYDRATGSIEFLNNIVSWYNAPDASGQAPNGWSAWARPDAVKVFIAFSDSSGDSSIDGATFDQKLLALQPAVFGTAQKRDYVFHSIIGLAENFPATAPWLPADPIVTGTCVDYSGGLGPGPAFQEVSKLSGGLRFPLCEFASFDVVFNEIATNVVTEVKIACDLPFPDAPPGMTIDPNTIVLDYTPGNGGAVQHFTQVVDLAACKAGAFYVDGMVIHLCPEACAAVESDSKASINVLYGCDTGFVK